MAALDFPASPTVGQVFTGGNGVIYTWNGLLWVASGASAGGDFMATNSVAIALLDNANNCRAPSASPATAAVGTRHRQGATHHLLDVTYLHVVVRLLLSGQLRTNTSLCEERSSLNDAA